MLKSGEFVIGTKVDVVCGETLGYAREKHIRQAVKNLYSEGITKSKRRRKSAADAGRGVLAQGNLAWHLIPGSPLQISTTRFGCMSPPLVKEERHAIA